ncbi:MAG: pantetheine-phosphate adenylyltransferase [Clostridia bacterium]|nr:pantetheine-phosphate adenylyltransferase [Clostridia bacterium]
MTILYPGSFDPPTKGHIDIARRAASMYDKVIVMVLMNPSKRSLVNVNDRAKLLRMCFKDVENIEVEIGERLLIDAVRRAGADAILRGLRGEPDYESEKPVAEAFLKMYGVETVFMQSDPALSFVSSTMVREIVRLGGNARGLVCDEIYSMVLNAYSGRND